MLLFNGPNINFVVFCAVFNYHLLCITAARAEGSGSGSILQAFVVVSCLFVIKKIWTPTLAGKSFFFISDDFGLEIVSSLGFNRDLFVR